MSILNFVKATNNVALIENNNNYHYYTRKKIKLERKIEKERNLV